ncbi:hypothetical protein NQ317_011780 [Molorchus minor]|uniref:N-acetyltransferase domain-containing protein n=1 Tax=Molorchus minor TaxID=1323400 RepID=A0ABQ9JHV3_9CUCU|nr:hypothetical protein NQ317_011780 [Molorchus minor]
MVSTRVPKGPKGKGLKGVKDKQTMTATNDDILVDIPDEDIPKLAEMYEKYIDLLPYAYSMTMTAIEWRRKSNKEYITLTSPYGRWKEDGTVFALVKTCCCKELYIYSLKMSSKNIYEALTQSRRLKFSQLNFLSCIHEHLYPVVRKAIEEKQLITTDIDYYMFAITKEEASKFVIECPPDVYIEKLDKSHAAEVNSRWSHRFQNSEKFVALLMDMNDAYGVFLKSNGELVAWVLLCALGQLAILQTKEGYERRGYASLVTQYMSKELAKKGHNAFATVLVHNTPSVSMFKKLGFQILGHAYYMLLNLIDNEILRDSLISEIM